MRLNDVLKRHYHYWKRQEGAAVLSRGYIDITGQRFGRLTVIEYAGKTSRYISLWRCRCDCGREKVVSRKNLIGGGTRSCGCLFKDRQQHGEAVRGSRSKLYNIWVSMRQRCHNPNSPAWKWYGEKGISVCPEWEDYDKFHEWALSSGYVEGLSIDRIDSDGDYEPSNCRWIPLEENAARARISHGGTSNGQ